MTPAKRQLLFLYQITSLFSSSGELFCRRVTVAFLCSPLGLLDVTDRLVCTVCFVVPCAIC